MSKCLDIYDRWPTSMVEICIRDKIYFLTIKEAVDFYKGIFLYLLEEIYRTPRSFHIIN